MKLRPRIRSRRSFRRGFPSAIAVAAAALALQAFVLAVHPGGCGALAAEEDAAPNVSLASTSAPLYVVNNPGQAPFTVTGYPAASRGNAAPSFVISDPDLGQPSGIAVDLAGNIYVANLLNDAVTEYAKNGSGGFSLIPALAGPMTELSECAGVALDGRGRIYVANASAPSVTVYAPRSRGDTPPLAAISGPATGLGIPFAVAVDPDGNVYVADLLAPSIREFAAGNFGGNSAPVNVISGGRTGLAEPVGIAFDAQGNIYVADDTTNSVTEYAAGAAGDVAPLATIAGPSTDLDLPTGIAVDGAGNIYVANAGAGSLTEYAAGSSGDVASIVIIAGPNTGLGSPRGIAIASLPTPTATPSSTPSPTPSPIPSATPTPSLAPRFTPTPSSGARLSLSTGSVDFATVGIGTKPVTRILRVWNSGTGRLVAGVDLGSIAMPFKVTAKRGPFSLPRNQAVVISVQFAPGSPGTFTGTIGISSSDPNNRARDVLVTGTGVPGKLIAADAIDFGIVAVGRRKTLTMVIANAGEGMLHVRADASGLSAPFAPISGTGKFTLANGGSRPVKLRFAPASAGSFRGTLTITSDDGNLPLGVKVTGTGG